MDQGFNSMTLQQTLTERLMPGHNPYKDFPVQSWAGTWYGDPAAERDIFKRAIDQSKPGLVIEVGSFVGESTLFMARHLKSTQRDAAILCVDTWLGGFDHWTRVPEKLRFVHGHPSLYYQFLGNVMARNCQDVIVPLVLDSMNAARLLNSMGIIARMVFIDASHEEGDVIRDLEAYWNLLSRGGIMLVDDANGGFPGVTNDLRTFVSKYGLQQEQDGEKALLIKP
jgi:cephalosporin hydroxylase